MKRTFCIGILGMALVLLSAEFAAAEAQKSAYNLTPQSRLQYGVSLYGRGYWSEALTELRQAYAETANVSLKADSLYWIAMTEMAAGNYGDSVRAMDELERLTPGNTKYAEISYHRGRVYYYLGRL